MIGPAIGLKIVDEKGMISNAGIVSRFKFGIYKFCNREITINKDELNRLSLKPY